MNVTEAIAVFLQAVGGYRPAQELDERMHGFTQICRMKWTHAQTCTIGGHARSGDLHHIGRDAFGLNLVQRRTCMGRAKDFLAQLDRNGPTSDGMKAALKFKEAA